MKSRLSLRNFFFRLVCLIALLFITILEIGPVPVSSLTLMLVVLFRPEWFYTLIQKIYGVKSD